MPTGYWSSVIAGHSICHHESHKDAVVPPVKRLPLHRQRSLITTTSQAVTNRLTILERSQNSRFGSSSIPNTAKMKLAAVVAAFASVATAAPSGIKASMP
ncbi:Uncharacterized protein HZ326_23836 [Fusarium oxysporum f. sp. albedinis]|nr:Uncharacterized protein HZ326_23836 [Fusarium oxysporum f. sp. albedinis]